MRLEAAGYLTRGEPATGRNQPLTLTTAGHAALNDALALVDDQENHFFAPLDQDHRELVRASLTACLDPRCGARQLRSASGPAAPPDMSAGAGGWDTVEIDVGGAGEISLQSATATRFNRVRTVSDDEATRITAAISFVRRYSHSNPISLLLSEHEALADSVRAAEEPSAGAVLPWHANRVRAGLVSWLLLWGLTLDHWRHDISDRFGRTSSEYACLEAATHHAYDGHRGYRIAGAMRNLVAHREIPPLHINQRHTRGASGQQHTRLTITLAPSWFLNGERCPRVLRADLEGDPDLPIDMTASVQDAMDGLSEIVRVLAEIDGPELTGHLALLQTLLVECEPGVPVLVSADTGDVPSGVRITFNRLNDLVPLLHEVK